MVKKGGGMAPPNSLDFFAGLLPCDYNIIEILRKGGSILKGEQ